MLAATHHFMRTRTAQTPEEDQQDLRYTEYPPLHLTTKVPRKPRYCLIDGPILQGEAHPMCYASWERIKRQTKFSKMAVVGAISAVSRWNSFVDGHPGMPYPLGLAIPQQSWEHVYDYLELRRQLKEEELEDASE